jgi:hypothetical protein
MSSPAPPTDPSASPLPMLRGIAHASRRSTSPAIVCTLAEDSARTNSLSPSRPPMSTKRAAGRASFFRAGGGEAGGGCSEGGPPALLSGSDSTVMGARSPVPTSPGSALGFSLSLEGLNAGAVADALLQLRVALQAQAYVCAPRPYPTHAVRDVFA